MNNNQIFNRSTKENFIKKVNASNEAARLENQVKAYNNNIKKNNKLLNSYNNIGSNNQSNIDNNSSKASNSIFRFGSKSKNKPKNSAVTNELASTGLTAAGVPKPVADKLVNSKLGQKAIEAAKNRNKALALLDSLTGGKKGTEDDAPDGGAFNFKLSEKAIKYTIMAMPAVCFILIFCCLFMSASQIYLNSIKLGQADSISSADAEKEINKKVEDDLNQEIDDDVAFDYEINNTKSLSFSKTKLEQSNLVLTANKKRKYNEADLKTLEDFYPAIVDLSKGYDENMVYDFFYKMYNLYTFYRNEYNVEIDLPLLMATLNIQSNDMYVIFSSNLSSEDRNSSKRKDFSDFSYDKNWDGYITTSTTSTHDMEVLVQNMFSNQVTETCTDSNNKVTKENILRDHEIGTPSLKCNDGEKYNSSSPKLVKDEKKYREFLKEFIEKKYYLDGKTPLDGNYTYISNGNNSSSGGNNQTPGGNSTQPSTSSGEWRSWKQCGENWGNKLVPTSNSTMCQIGCVITSVTIQIVRSGTKTTKSNVDPWVAAQTFSFQSGGLFLWGSTTNLAPNFVYYTFLPFSGMNKSSIVDMLSKYDLNKYYMILSVRRTSNPSYRHYVALDYVDTNTKSIYIFDPGRNTNPNLYEAYDWVYGAEVYEKKD